MWLLYAGATGAESMLHLLKHIATAMESIAAPVFPHLQCDEADQFGQLLPPAPIGLHADFASGACVSR